MSDEHYVFREFDKIARLKRAMIVTEKIDGTNACVCVFPNSDLVAGDPHIIHSTGEFVMFAGSRTRWIAPEGTIGLPKGCDNFGFAAWVRDNAEELMKLGEGRHFGEWYGKGIQRNYGLQEKRFALFNISRWNEETKPACCHLVPRLSDDPQTAMENLHADGSAAVPGFGDPEGIVVYHSASRQLYKQTFDNDGGKWQASS